MCEVDENGMAVQKLRDAGVETELDLFEGMWHAFHMNTEMPESRKALADIASFFKRRLGS
jgi:monoterpene epsilon-lactone hydrolase